MSEKLVTDEPSTSVLGREMGFCGAALTGLRSMVGAGVFVSLGTAADRAGTAIGLAIGIGAIVSLCNGLNLIQLAAHSAYGSDTYGYSEGRLSPWWGFAAGWTLLLAQSAAAATAALGIANYLLNAVGLSEPIAVISTALAIVAMAVGMTLKGVRLSRSTHRLILLIALSSLLFFIGAGIASAIVSNADKLTVLFHSATTQPIDRVALLQASSLMIVAYAGYGQIAGLSQERQPHSIASLITALITAIITACLLYEGVTIAALSTVEAIVWGETVEGFVAPLERIAQNFNVPGSSMILAVGAIVAMSGILLHLITDLAWVMWTMGQQRDLSSRFARINAAGVPALGVLVVGGAIACVILNGSIATIWSFSAFNFLLYSAVTHLAAFHLTAPERLCPRWLTGISLVVCISLAFCFDWKLWLVWSGLVVIGVIWRGINQWSNQQSE